MVLQNQQLVLAQSPVNHQPARALSIAAGSEASAQLSLLRNLQIQYLQSYWQALSFKSSGKQSWCRDRRGCNCWQSYLRSDLNAFLFDSNSNRRTCPSKFACVIGSEIFEWTVQAKQRRFLSWKDDCWWCELCGNWATSGYGGPCFCKSVRFCSWLQVVDLKLMHLASVCVHFENEFCVMF